MSPDDPLIGAELDEYCPTRPLGKGGMGAVYEADDLSLRRKVALKVLLPQFVEDPTARERFQREINTAVAIEHPNVVPVYGAGFAPPHFYIAMRLIPGPDLAHVLGNDGSLEEERALRILGQVASALYAMHERELVHRDVKPHNVLLWGADSEDEHAMLTDFGIAKAVNDPRGLTGVGAIGTPAYMAPEVAVGGLATPASDQYSLGCMAYEMLSGELPFAGEPVDRVGATPPALGQIAPHVSPRVAEAVTIALRSEPAARHADVREFVKAAKASDEAFRESQRISETLAQTSKPEDTVGRLTTEHGLDEAAISRVTGLDRTAVLKLRRAQARGALVGRRQRPSANGV